MKGILNLKDKKPEARRPLALITRLPRNKDSL
jgi:hypothetical protein